MICAKHGVEFLGSCGWCEDAIRKHVNEHQIAFPAPTPEAAYTAPAVPEKTADWKSMYEIVVAKLCTERSLQKYLREAMGEEAWNDALSKWKPESTAPVEASNLREAEASRDNWMEQALQFCSNAAYYMGLLDKCAEYIGEAAYLSDDGSSHDSPVRAKIPELVATLVRAQPGKEGVK